MSETAFHQEAMERGRRGMPCQLTTTEEKLAYGITMLMEQMERAGGRQKSELTVQSVQLLESVQSCRRC